MNKYFLSFLIIPIFATLAFIYPKPIFQKELRYKYFSINYDSPVDTMKLRVLLDSADKRLNHKNISFTTVQNIYIPSSKNKLMFLSLSKPTFFGLNYNFNKILINNTNIDSNLVQSYSEKYNKRAFTGVIEHELTHTYLREKLGWFHFQFLLPNWKNEGYCDYISNGGSFPIQKGIELLKNDQTDDSHSFEYFIYFVRVKYLLDIKKVDINTLFEEDYDEKSLDKEVKFWLIKQDRL